ncbi:MAG: arsenate reductase (glutaredoxin) [Flavobacteriales bacterium]|nr:MAG: arsenate reductase (glutaredoxin) [Flavobacteriales bacterium]
MIQILHNNRCSKSRQCLAFLEDKNEDFEVIKYLENPLSVEEIKDLLVKLQLPAMDIVRTTEKIWKENFKGKEYSEEELISILAENPKLIQRPIVIKCNKAVVGRPLEKVEQLF